MLKGVDALAVHQGEEDKESWIQASRSSLHSLAHVKPDDDDGVDCASTPLAVSILKQKRVFGC